MIPRPLQYLPSLLFAVGIILSGSGSSARGQTPDAVEHVVTEREWIGWWIVEQPEGDNLYITLKAHGRASSFFSGDGSNKVDKGTWVYEGNRVVITWQDGFRDVLNRGAEGVLHTTHAPDVSINTAQAPGSVAMPLEEDYIGSLVDQETVDSGNSGAPPIPRAVQTAPPNRSEFIGFWEAQRPRGASIYLFLKRGGKAFRAESARSGRDLVVGTWEDYGSETLITWIDGSTEKIKQSGSTYTFNGLDVSGAIGPKEISAQISRVDASRVGEFFNLGTGPASAPDLYIGRWATRDLQGEVYYINIDRWSQAARVIYIKGVEIVKDTGRWSMLGDGVQVTWEDGTQNTLRAFTDSVRLSSYAPGTPVTGMPLSVTETQKVPKEEYDAYVLNARAEIEEIERAALARQRAEEAALRVAQEEAKRRAQEETRARALAEARRKAEEEARRLAEEDARRQALAIAREKGLAEERQREAELARQRAIEDARARAVAVAQAQAEEDQRRREEEEARLARAKARRTAEEEGRLARVDAKRLAESEVRSIREAEARRRGEALAEERAREATEARSRAETDAQRRAQEVARARAKAEAAAHRRAEALARIKADEEARKRAIPPKPETMEEKAQRLANVRPARVLEEEARREAKLLPPAAIEQEARQRVDYKTYAALQEAARVESGVRSADALQIEASATASQSAKAKLQESERQHLAKIDGTEIESEARQTAGSRVGPVPLNPLAGRSAHNYEEGAGVAFWQVTDSAGDEYSINLLTDGAARSTDAKGENGFNGRTGRWSPIAVGYAIRWDDGGRNRIGPTGSGFGLFRYELGSTGQGPGELVSQVKSVGPANAEIWEITFEDTFQSDSIAFDKWSSEVPAGIPSNEKIAGFKANNLNVKNGILTISANDYGMTVGGRYLQYSTGFLSTRGKFAQAYGYFEIRFRAPEGNGILPFFWLTSETNAEKIAIFDILGHEPDRVHFETAVAGGERTDSWDHKGPDFSKSFHTVGIRWSPRELVTYIDGFKRNSTAMAIPQSPLELAAGILVGHEKTGVPSGWTPFPANLEIDYVRAFERDTKFIDSHRTEIAKLRADAQAQFESDLQVYKNRNESFYGDALSNLKSKEKMRFEEELRSIRAEEEAHAAREYRRLEQEDRMRYEATLGQMEKTQADRYEAAVSALKSAERMRYDGILAGLRQKENSRYEAELSRLKAEAEARRQAALARIRAEEEVRRKAEEAAHRIAEAEAQRIAEERRKIEEVQRRIAEAEAQRRAEAEALRLAELEKRRAEEEAARIATREEARRIAEAKALEAEKAREQRRLEREARMQQAAIARTEAEAERRKAESTARAERGKRPVPTIEERPSEITPARVERPPTPVSSPPTSVRPVFEDAFAGGPRVGPLWTYGWPLPPLPDDEISVPVDRNVSQNNGRLLLVAKNERIIFEGERRSYSGGMVTSSSSIPGAYGYIEFKAKVPMGQGLSSSFRMIDEMTNREVVAIQVLGQEPDRVHMVISTGESGSMSSSSKGPDFSLGFHTIGILWSKEQLIFFVDGSEVESLSRGVPERPVKLSFSLGVGGTKAGEVNGWTPFPAQLEIETIRYSR